MTKDIGNVKKRVIVSASRGHVKNNSPNRAAVKGGSARGAVSGAAVAGKQGRQAFRNSLLKAAIAFFLLSIVVIFYMGDDSTPVLVKKNEDLGQNGAARVSSETVKKTDDAEIVRTNDTKNVPAPIISAVRITPSQPVPTDRIKAEPVLAGGDSAGLVFSYRWKVNGLFVEGKVTDTLSGMALKRRDTVSVVVSAIRDGLDGPVTESPTVVIHSPPPSLEMKIMTKRFRVGDTIELQLLGAAPDGDQLIFSLVSPLIDGMTLDGKSGRIVWRPERLFPGKLHFGAAAVDTDGNRTVRVFEIDMSAGGLP
jgi:hypothetical protein